jgi:hypothetical protein
MQKRNSIRFGTPTGRRCRPLLVCQRGGSRPRGVHDNQCDSWRFIESKVPWKMNLMSTSEVGTDVASCGAGQVLKCLHLCCSTGIAHHRPTGQTTGESICASSSRKVTMIAWTLFGR